MSRTNEMLNLMHTWASDDLNPKVVSTAAQAYGELIELQFELDKTPDAVQENYDSLDEDIKATIDVDSMIPMVKLNAILGCVYWMVDSEDKPILFTAIPPKDIQEYLERYRRYHEELVAIMRKTTDDPKEIEFIDSVEQVTPPAITTLQKVSNISDMLSLFDSMSSTVE